MAKDILRFPKDFLWGAGTSAHQVEGNNLNNDWWAFEQTAQTVHKENRSGIACDWWKKAEEDFDRAASLGINALKLSLEWSRIEPEEGKWDTHALTRYREMLTALQRRGIEPMVGLCHFTTPLWLAAKGGWENPNIEKYFENYTRKTVSELGDLVKLWWTINEPSIHAYLGYGNGFYPPNRRTGRLGFHVLRKMLLAHVASAKLIHELDRQALVGVPHAFRGVEQANPKSLLDGFAKRLRNQLSNTPVLSALTEGILQFPVGLNERISSAPILTDWLGINYYTVDSVRFAFNRPLQLFTEIVPVKRTPEYPEWFGRVDPMGLYKVLKDWAQFGKPIYITENGLMENTDINRPGYILRHLAVVHRAISEGIPVRGYFYWSLIDCFEWMEGYKVRFGLIHLNFKTQERTLKLSGELFGEIARTGAITPDMVTKYAPEVMQELFPTVQREPTKPEAR